MRIHRNIIVFAGAFLCLGAMIWCVGNWSVIPGTHKLDFVKSRDVHFKLKPGHCALAAMSIDESAMPLFTRSTNALAIDRREAMANGDVPNGSDVPDLSTWYRIENVESPEIFVQQLLARDDVASAFVAPDAQPALVVSHNANGEKSGQVGEKIRNAGTEIPGQVGVINRPPISVDEKHFNRENSETTGKDRCPIDTPPYDPLQGYMAPAPGGIDVASAWAMPGGRGGNVAFADIEGGWNSAHEDLPTNRMEHVAGQQIEDRGWQAHGTAVVGVIASLDNNLGMVGIAPNVQRIVTASLEPYGTANAIDKAQAALNLGDVLLIELHARGPRRKWIPMEYWDDVYDVVKLATSRGIIVVAAAGNGGENLSHNAYQRRFDRTFRDSGAILVGAGAPNRKGFSDRMRLRFSNYGERVDLQGWGEGVASLDYGDLQDCGAPHRRKYTNTFNGTSSASPVVAGAALLVQSVYKAKTGHVLKPLVLRELLKRTGTPQVVGKGREANRLIGPRPDLAKALADLMGTLDHDN